ncbi:RDD family protein [Nocardioides cynanchi]|uniref:RDD family protein n=1 Tax=Nocardioides cynanchi TaxID=2558918 RepID=UPI001783FD17|nr:RDD family protein [Nocardioides cynanchi]
MSSAVAPTATPARTAPTPETGLRVAETDRRFYAFAVDRLIAWGIDLAFALAAQHYLISRGHVWGGVLVIVATVLVVGGVFAALLGLTGSTPGKAFCGLRVIDSRTGRPIGMGPALLRTVVVAGATVPFGFGLAALAWTALADPDRLARGWHDRLVSSLVVDVRPVPAAEEPEQSAPRGVVNLTAMRLVPARRTPPGPDPARLPARAPTRDHRARPATGDAGESGRTTVRDPALAAAASGGTTATPEASPAPSAWGLVFDTGERVRVESVVLIGRRPEPREGEQGARLVGLPSTDMSVSKTHAQVALAPDGTLVVTDRGSTNGSVLRRQGVARRLTAGRPATLLDGDVVNLGDRTMTVVRVG